MIIQNTLLDFITKTPQASQDREPVASTEKSSAFELKDSFGKVMEKAQYKNSGSDSKSPAAEQGHKVGSEGRERFNTYKEAARKGIQDASNEKTRSYADRTEEIDQSDKGPEKEDAAKSADDIAVNILAAMLKMDEKELTEVLNSMDIKPEELADQSKTSDIANRISKFLGLNTQQSQALADILKMLESQTETSLEKQLPDSGKNPVPDSRTLNADNSKLEVDTPNKAFTGLEELMAGFKSKLEELTLKFMQSPDKVSNEFAEEIKKILEQFNAQGLKAGVKADDASSRQVEDPKALPADKAADESAKKVPKDDKSVPEAERQEDKAVKADNGKADLKDSGEAESSMPNNFKTDQPGGVQSAHDNKTAEFNSLLQNQTWKSDESAAVAKMHKNIPISNKELFSQIVEKAKVVTNGDKSEMVMDLKPDSLGKLSLKIVTEHGIVTAKFIAESQQVKETIETNMQLLKDSLEKQGLSVQGFSVSVGQQSSNGFRRENEFKSGAKQAGDRAGTANSKVVGIRSISEGLDRVNPYNLSESSIDLTA